MTGARLRLRLRLWLRRCQEQMVASRPREVVYQCHTIALRGRLGEQRKLRGGCAPSESCTVRIVVETSDRLVQQRMHVGIMRTKKGACTKS